MGELGVQELIEIWRFVTGASRRMPPPIRLQNHFMKRQRPKGLWRFRFVLNLPLNLAETLGLRGQESSDRRLRFQQVEFPQGNPPAALARPSSRTAKIQGMERRQC